ncbi:MAG: heme exporter protein CcmD [Thioalkalispiraceae bacterium]|jgi:heme exporter protein D
MKEFLHMGGYAAFVWSAYGIATVVLIVSLILPLLENKKIRRHIVRMLHEEQD